MSEVKTTMSVRAAYAGVVLSVLAVVALACAAPVAAPRSTGERPAERLSPSATPGALAATGDVVYVREMSRRSDLLAVDADTGQLVRRLPWGVSSPDGSVLYRVELDAGNTAVRALDAATGAVLRQRILTGPSSFELPTIGMPGEPSGLSPDGRFLALRARVADTSRFLVLDTDLRGPSTPVELAGEFVFDALSSGGSTLYLEEHIDPGRPQYRIRAYDLRGGTLLPGVIADKVASGDMVGTRVAAVASPDGQWLFSLYTNADKPFIHGLNLAQRFSVCLFLPTAKGDGSGEEQFGWFLAAAPDGRKAYAVNNVLGVIAEVDLVRARIARSSSFAAARTQQTPLEALLRWFVPIAEAKAEAFSTAVVSPDGATLYTTTDWGRTILAISTETLTLRTRVATVAGLMGLGVSPDGARLYATTGDGRSLFRYDAATLKFLGGLNLASSGGRILRVAPR